MELTAGCIVDEMELAAGCIVDEMELTGVSSISSTIPACSTID